MSKLKDNVWFWISVTVVIMFILALFFFAGCVNTDGLNLNQDEDSSNGNESVDTNQTEETEINETIEEIEEEETIINCEDTINPTGQEMCIDSCPEGKVCTYVEGTLFSEDSCVCK